MIKKNSRFLSSIEEKEKTAVVFVFSDWCEICEYLYPHVENIDEFLSDVDVFVLDAEDVYVEEFLEQRNITKVPFFSIFVEGIELGRQEGIVVRNDDNGDQFMSDFKDHLKNIFLF